MTHLTPTHTLTPKPHTHTNPPLPKGGAGLCGSGGFPLSPHPHKKVRAQKIYYRPWLKQFSRNHRNKSTLGEVLLWNKLKGKRLMGYQFLRQKPIENYIVDFFCYKLKLIIEVDGSSHQNKVVYDLMRQQQLEALGWNVLRIDDRDVKKDMYSVLEAIRFYIKMFEREREIGGERVSGTTPPATLASAPFVREIGVGVELGIPVVRLLRSQTKINKKI
jgi:very-short-patch-repair endonuclease